FGSGSSLKTRILLQHLHKLAAYVPVDISEDHLQESAEAVQREFPETEVLPIVADFTRSFDLPEPVVEPLRNLVYFPGSTIGNFTRDTAVDLLKVMRQIAGEHGALLIGADLQKDPETIERAYNDSAGVTAKFNLNVLNHINNAYDGNFDASRFRHRADYNRNEGRIEMYLVSNAEQEVSIGGENLVIEKGEAILTEYSHKYTLEGFAEMAAEADFEVDHVWLDDERLFSVQYLTRS
ncbi:MAG: L-histidine N(alpha)-methyltransferase, partial [Gammaproteobacteria bacterium]|nr:L-histidine N(alpha)-methyltransferase [Gammaproteobacteria bacterium]